MTDEDRAFVTNVLYALAALLTAWPTYKALTFFLYAEEIKAEIKDAAIRVAGRRPDTDDYVRFAFNVQRFLWTLASAFLIYIFLH